MFGCQHILDFLMSGSEWIIIVDLMHVFKQYLTDKYKKPAAPNSNQMDVWNLGRWSAGGLTAKLWNPSNLLQKLLENGLNSQETTVDSALYQLVKKFADI